MYYTDETKEERHIERFEAEVSQLREVLNHVRNVLKDGTRWGGSPNIGNQTRKDMEWIIDAAMQDADND